MSLAFCPLSACADEESGAPANPSPALAASRKSEPKAGPPVDRPLESWRTDLLDLAFRSVSKLPLDPHVKDRAKWQAFVVDACFELHQPARALAYIRDIPNWRKYRGLTDYAFYCAQHGHTGEVPSYLDLARKHTEAMAQSADTLAWRRDEILRGIARTEAVLGRFEAADAAASKTSNAAAALGSAHAADLVRDDNFRRRLAEVDAALASRDFEQIKAALRVCVELFDRFYEDVSRRVETEKRVTMKTERLPQQLCVERGLDLCDAALAHGGKEHTGRLVTHVQMLLDRTKWEPGAQVTYMARIAGCRARAGDAKGARSQLAAALEYFEKNKEVAENGGVTEVILNFDRVEALLPSAAAWHALGDRAMAAKSYARLVELAVVNPNSRPRVEDLAQICCSMARQGFEPDAKLMARIREVAAQLASPW